MSCGAITYRKQDIVNDVSGEKGVCKLERYIEMSSVSLMCVFGKMAAYMKGDYNNVCE